MKPSDNNDTKPTVGVFPEEGTSLTATLLFSQFSLPKRPFISSLGKGFESAVGVRVGLRLRLMAALSVRQLLMNFFQNIYLHLTFSLILKKKIFFAFLFSLC